MVLLKSATQRLDPDTAGDRKGSQVVGHSRRLGRDEVSQGLVILPFGFRPLLPESVEGRMHRRPAFIRIQFNIVTHAISGEKAIDRLRHQQLLVDNLLQESLSIVEQFFRFRTDIRIIEDLWIAPAQLPCVKKWRPVDEGNNPLKRHGIQNPDAEKVRLRDIHRLPVTGQPPGPRLLEGQERLGTASLVTLAYGILL